MREAKKYQVRIPRQDVLPVTKLVRQFPFAQVTRRIPRDMSIVETQHIDRRELGKERQAPRRVNGQEWRSIREGCFQKPTDDFPVLLPPLSASHIGLKISGLGYPQYPDVANDEPQ